MYFGKITGISSTEYCLNPNGSQCVENSLLKMARVVCNLHLGCTRYKQITSMKDSPSPAPKESLSYWFQGSFFAAIFVLNVRLIKFLLSAFANRFGLRCEPKQLMLLYYKF